METITLGRELTEGDLAPAEVWQLDYAMSFIDNEAFVVRKSSMTGLIIARRRQPGDSIDGTKRLMEEVLLRDYKIVVQNLKTKTAIV